MSRNKVSKDVGAPFFFGCEGECRLRMVVVMTQATKGDLVAATGNHVATFFFIIFLFLEGFWVVV